MLDSEPPLDNELLAKATGAPLVVDAPARIPSTPLRHPLNGICPYYTMFPIEFPLAHLTDCEPGSVVLDPFCGRGTTLFAARLLGLDAVGIDANPVAVAISKAKLVQPNPSEIVNLAQKILLKTEPAPKPPGEFWDWAFHPSTLQQVLKLRAGLRGREGAAASALRGIVLGALHGPQPKNKHSYFSNQMQRTFAPKPNYAVRYWAARDMKPPAVDVIGIISERAARYFGEFAGDGCATARAGDARSFRIGRQDVAKTVTSPPYFGMATYVPDQWLRNWFVGGDPAPTYRHPHQISFGTSETFASELAKVWRRVAGVTKVGGELVIRFGALASRPCDPTSLLLSSLAYEGSTWEVSSVNPAGDATAGRRQAVQMGDKLKSSSAINEIDVICKVKN